MSYVIWFPSSECYIPSTQLENKTVNYFGNASGFLVYPNTTTTSSIKNNTTANNSIIPEYVFDAINKNASRYTFFKKFENEFELEKDRLYIEKALKCRDKNDSWTDFIFTNVSLQNN